MFGQDNQKLTNHYEYGINSKKILFFGITPQTWLNGLTLCGVCPYSYSLANFCIFWPNVLTTFIIVLNI